MAEEETKSTQQREIRHRTRTKTEPVAEELPQESQHVDPASPVQTPNFEQTPETVSPLSNTASSHQSRSNYSAQDSAASSTYNRQENPETYVSWLTTESPHFNRPSSSAGYYPAPFGNEQPSSSVPESENLHFDRPPEKHRKYTASFGEDPQPSKASEKEEAQYKTPFGASGEEPEKKNAVQKILGLITPRKIAIAVCVIVFCVSSFLLIRYFVEVGSAKKASQEVTSLYQPEAESTAVPTATAEATATPQAQTKATAVPPTNSPAAQPTQASATNLSVTDSQDADTVWPKTYANNPTMRIAASFSQMRAKNKDVVAWMKIEDVLEEAVVQRDNTYYLTHDMLGKTNKTGALFLDEDCNLETVPTQFVVYGHNMKEGAMFGSLKKYKLKGAAFYREHPYIEFNTIYENGKYVIFAVIEANVNYGSRSYFPFWYYSRFNTVEEFNEYVALAKELSMVECGVTAEPGDRLLVLSTCTGTNDDTRLIVLARKIRDGEDELILQSQVMSSSDR